MLWWATTALVLTVHPVSPECLHIAGLLLGQLRLDSSVTGLVDVRDSATVMSEVDLVGFVVTERDATGRPS